MRAVEVLYDLFDSQEEHDLVCIPFHLYEQPSDEALHAKIHFFNNDPVDIAIELHLNAGGGDYSTAICWDTRDGRISEKGSRLAAAICHQMEAVYPWRCIGAQGQSYFGRKLAFLQRIQAPSVLVEPGFMSHPFQRAVFESDVGIIQYATAVFNGVARYGEGA